MAFEVIQEKPNVFFSRREVTARMTAVAATPSRKEVVDAVCERFGVKPDVVAIEKISQGFGAREAMVYARIYSSASQLKRLERSYLLERGKPKEKKEKAEKAAKAAPKKEEKKEEAKK